ncbi:hypothetical protein LV89_02447 [Arcicella aurantiaca]|uniref:Uncharacterized protein n=1 Tax=Arcicella aurantiaca TaxID=591202 RepID=A0A316EAB9_9BACT|nr:hypothetical protein [Arcicella aurantiaca]PWK26598.1 hypothetical protein LV89_02447 [Arcicella aurantiaca]
MTHTKLNSYLNVLSGIAIVIIIGLFYIACYHFAYNFFFEDDFHLLRYVTLTQDNSLSISEKLKALWNLHNEHRIVFPRLIVLLDYYIQGHIDWKILNALSALYYLGIFVFFYKIIKKINLPIWYALPIVLFIFQPSSYQNFYWTISILQQVGNIFWSMLLFYSIVYFSPKHFWISIIFALILTFTHGNGLFALGVVAVLLFIQERYKELIIWCLLILIISVAYFLGYYTAQNSNIIGSLSNPLQLIGCFGGFWGSFLREFFKSNLGLYIAILTGLIIFGSLFILNFNFLWSIFFKKKKLKSGTEISREKLFILAIFAFFTITSGLVALSRSWSSIEAGFPNRYLHNSVITLMLLYLSILVISPKKVTEILGIIFLGFGIMYNCFAWYTKLEALSYQRDIQEADAVNYQHNGISLVNDKSFNANISDILKQSFKDSISVFPESPLSSAIKNLDNLTAPNALDIPINIQKDSSVTFSIAGSNYRPIYHLQNSNLPYTGDVFLIFKSKQNLFVWATTHLKNKKKNLLKTGQYFNNGFYTTIMTDAMPANDYTIGILQKNNNHFIYYPTKYKIQNH